MRGDAGQHVLTIRGGLVKLVQYLPDGTQRIVRLLRHGAPPMARPAWSIWKSRPVDPVGVTPKRSNCPALKTETTAIGARRHRRPSGAILNSGRELWPSKRVVFLSMIG